MRWGKESAAACLAVVLFPPLQGWAQSSVDNPPGDGTTMVGYGTSTAGREAFRWTPAMSDKAKAAEPIRWIAESSENPLNREIARRIGPLVENVPVRVIEPGGYYLDPHPRSLKFGNGATTYTHGRGRITIYLRSDRGLNEKTMLHEGAHAATMGVIRTRPDNPAVQRLNELLDIVRQETTDSADKHVFFATKDVDEYVAWSLTDPGFQNVLKSIQVEPAKVAGQRFAQLVRQILGLDPSANTALEETLAASLQLIEDAKSRRFFRFGDPEEDVVLTSATGMSPL